MYVSVQKIFGKSKVYGYSKDVVTTTLNTGTTILYEWQYSSEKFERENYSYKIVVKESYRDGGKVKQKQVVMGTFHWFDFIDHPVYCSEYFDDKLIETFPDKPDETEKIYDEIDKKISDIQAVESKKWTDSKEYKVHNRHLEMIRKYESKKTAYDEIYGKGIFEQIYDIHLKVMNQSLYEELLESIRKRVKEKKRGNIESIIITQDKVIVSGHQRIRACNVLGIDEVSYKMIQYENEEKEVKDLIESNLRQRVLGNTNSVKLGRCFIFLNKYYGFERGGNGSNQYEQKVKLLTIANPNIPSNQIELADSYNITRQTMNNYMRMASMIPELEDLVDTGIVTKDTALAIIKNLTNDEQRELISSMDITKKITKKETKKYIDEIKSLKKENKDLKSSNLSAEKLSTLKIENEKLEKENKILESQKNIR